MPAVSTGAYTTVAVEFEGPVATVTLNRPDKLNALNHEMAEELAEALRMVGGSDAVRCIVLTGAGRAFCAGGDIPLLAAIAESGDEAAGRRLVDGARAVHAAIRAAPQPVLGCINGVAAGGGVNIALGCDLRIAGESAKFGQVFARLGLHPDWGGSYFLPRMVGAAKALELFLSAELVPAAKALEFGIVNKVVPDAELKAASTAWAKQIAAAPPLAVRRIKQSVYASESSSLDEMLDRELDAQLALFRTADFKEGLASFREKRDPRFQGH